MSSDWPLIGAIQLAALAIAFVAQIDASALVQFLSTAFFTACVVLAYDRIRARKRGR